MLTVLILSMRMSLLLWPLLAADNDAGAAVHRDNGDRDNGHSSLPPVVLIFSFSSSCSCRWVSWSSTGNFGRCESIVVFTDKKFHCWFWLCLFLSVCTKILYEYDN